jgi:hypothetical protein
LTDRFLAFGKTIAKVSFIPIHFNQTFFNFHAHRTYTGILAIQGSNWHFLKLSYPSSRLGHYQVNMGHLGSFFIHVFPRNQIISRFILHEGDFSLDFNRHLVNFCLKDDAIISQFLSSFSKISG